MVTILVMAGTGVLVAGMLLGAWLQSIKEKSDKELNAYQTFIGTTYEQLAYSAAKTIVNKGDYNLSEVKDWRYTTRLFRYWLKKYPSLLLDINVAHSNVTGRINVRFNFAKDLEGQTIILTEVIPWLLFEVDANGDKVGKPWEFWRYEWALKTGVAQCNVKLWAGFSIIDPWGNPAIESVTAA